MAGLNKVMLIGNLGRDPETKQMPNGDLVANFTIATSETWKDRATGEKREATEWHRIVAYRGLADVVSRYLSKGSKVYIEGKIKSRKWQDKDGNDRQMTEIIADQMQMLDGRHQPQGSEPSTAFAASQQMQMPPQRDDDDIPF